MNENPEFIFKLYKIVTLCLRKQEREYKQGAGMYIGTDCKTARAL